MITSYDTLPLGIWLDICRVSAATDREDIDKQVAILALLSGQTERAILNLPIADFQRMSAESQFLAVQPVAARRPADRYRAGDFTLIPTLDLRKLTTAQYIDFQAYAPEADAKLAELLSVFLVPEGKDYGDGYDTAAVQQAIREGITVADTVTLSAFFFKSWLELTEATRRSLEKALTKATRSRDTTKQAKALQGLKVLSTHSRSVGDGLRRLTS